MPQDYILRLLQQLGAIVATIAGKRTAGDFAGAEHELNEQCLRHTGLPLVVAKQASSDDLQALLAMGGQMQLHRSLILAELLRQDAELAKARGNPLEAVVSLRRALDLVERALPALVGEEAAAFREAQQTMVTQLRDLGG